MTFLCHSAKCLCNVLLQFALFYQYHLYITFDCNIEQKTDKRSNSFNFTVFGLNGNFVWICWLIDLVFNIQKSNIFNDKKTKPNLTALNLQDISWLHCAFDPFVCKLILFIRTCPNEFYFMNQSPRQLLQNSTN